MSSEGCSLLKNEDVDQARERSAETLANNISEALNACRPLLSIPTELLQEIMAYIPDPVPWRTHRRFEPTWHADLYDTTMLIPISQTCRRLRFVALGCRTLWTNVACGPRPRTQYLIERSGGLPLMAYLSVDQAPPLCFGLQDVAGALRARIRELDISEIRENDTLDPLLSDALPMLESLAVKWYFSRHCRNGTYSNVVRLTRDRAPRLRRLAYSMCDIASLDILASLTHLSLNMYYVAYIHERIAAMLSVCYALQSLHLDTVSSFDFWPHCANSSDSTPSPLPSQACRHLRRVALVSLDGHLIAYILSLLTEKTKLDVQIHSVLRDLHFPLPRHFLGAISKVGIARYPRPAPFYKFPRPPDSPFMWGITLSGSERTVRRVGDEFEALTRMLYEEDAALAGVRELWLADVSPATCDEPHMLRAAEADQVRALIQGMPALETVVLVNQFQAPWTGAPPSLRLLPDEREGDGHVGPRPSTVRIVHGYGKHVLQRWSERPNPTPSVPPLNLTCILEELASGAYDYIQHLAIEVPYHVAFDAGDFERLREHCDTVPVKVADVTPTISLPAYCYEPNTWAASDDPWPYKLW